MSTEALKSLDFVVSEELIPEPWRIINAFGAEKIGGVSLVSLVQWACDPSDLRAMGAAVELMKAVLPGWRARVDIGRRFRAWTISPKNQKLDVYSTSPARALVLAVIRAKIAEGVDK